jgi:hypothetical protein
VFDPTDKCPTFFINASIAGLALEKQHADEVEYARLVKENLPVASTFSGLDGGMNKVFLARFPDRIIPLAIVLTNGPQLPQMSPIPWTDNNGSLADKVFLVRIAVFFTDASRPDCFANARTGGEFSDNEAVASRLNPFSPRRREGQQRHCRAERRT